MWRLKSHTYTILLQNYAGNRQQSYKIMKNVRNIGQGEAQHIKYKRLKLGGGQAYDLSSV
jgi:hypothetical protein